MSKTKRQIIVEGSGGMATLLNLYLLAQTGKKNPKLCFLPTAGMDGVGYARYVVEMFNELPFQADYLCVTQPPTKDLNGFLSDFDIVYVGGGNSKVCLALWKEYGLDTALNNAYHNGTILSGGSAGMVVWFEEALSDWFPGELSYLECLGLLPFSACPHYSSKERRKQYSAHIKSKALKAGYAADDCAALHFVNEKWYRSVSLFQKAKTFKVERQGDKIQHHRLKTYALDNAQHQKELLWNSPSLEYLQFEEPDEQKEQPKLLPEAN